MKKLILILIAILILGSALFWAVAVGPLKQFIPTQTQETLSSVVPDYFRGDRGASVQPGSQLPASSPSKPAEPVWTFKGTDGTAIEVSHFAAQSSTTASSSQSGSESQPPAQNIDIAGTNDPLSPYIISYIASDQSFNIGLFKEPLGEVRKQAEQELLARLKISEGQACRLKYVVVTPYWVSGFYSGKNLGFSFCPGATQL